MSLVKVWYYDLGPANSITAGLRFRATSEAITNMGAKLLENSALEVDERLIARNGITRPEYITFRVRVKHSQAFAGYTAGENRKPERVNVLAGEYDARLTVREFVTIVGAENCLQLVGADARGGDLWIKTTEYDELFSFPNGLNDAHIEVLSERVTSADEL
ncbi:hypothetical protein [Burkholderia multivorans]|uniref:hypothetical protein n=1 Tax=Burkholderia multivorans TaxID=87883 RepID=UPI000D003734|nr:hypothetical protein [Burkholderia multivorans]MCL4627703.1 hypothetical protein [Burkholderia multivorans]MCO1390800.1 hypothetical protein [Burkholderia multivorans]MDN7431635.1 hypothetical protein [Burkholderia multivorans]PRD81695.1 hypothetical protein C6P76_27030 [Burkholderia multivorans]UQO13073.1 hypothetical protein L0Z40_21295 [Burkholderia multivorans]